MGVEAVENGQKRVSWMIIGPDGIPAYQTGAFDLASFLRRKLAFAVTLSSA
jgi:hypothetical protein